MSTITHVPNSGLNSFAGDCSMRQRSNLFGFIADSSQEFAANALERNLVIEQAWQTFGTPRTEGYDRVQQHRDTVLSASSIAAGSAATSDQPPRRRARLGIRRNPASRSLLIVTPS
jgi:hypothetical protein